MLRIVRLVGVQSKSRQLPAPHGKPGGIESGEVRELVDQLLRGAATRAGPAQRFGERAQPFGAVHTSN
jgi:hypothetical protein